MSDRKTRLENYYREKAKKEKHKEGEIEIDDNATVNLCPQEGGAYVQAWVWIYRK